jgi:hypothetical protein
MKVYTLQEAAQILAYQQCIEYQHDWQEMKADDVTVQMYCDRCGASASVTQPTIPEGREI